MLGPDSRRRLGQEFERGSWIHRQWCDSHHTAQDQFTRSAYLVGQLHQSGQRHATTLLIPVQAGLDQHAERLRATPLVRAPATALASAAANLGESTDCTSSAQPTIERA